MEITIKTRTSRGVQKAARLLLEKALADTDARSFYVRGDSGQHLVTIVTGDRPPSTGTPAPKAICSCPFGRTAPQGRHCAHITAAYALLESERDPFRGLRKSS